MCLEKMNEKLIDLKKDETAYLKGIAILLVLMGHLGMIWRGGAWGVNIFLFVSGFGQLKAFRERNLEYFWTRKARIYFTYIPVIVMQLIVLVGSSYHGKGKTILHSLLGLGTEYNIDKTMWFIAFIYIYFLLFWVCGFLLSKLKALTNLHKEIILAFILVLATIFIVRPLCCNTSFFHSGSGAEEYVFAYPAGVLAGVMGNIKFTPYRKFFLKVLCAGMIVAGGAYIGRNYMNSSGLHMVLYDYLGAIVIVAVILGFHVAPLKKVFLLLGKYSYTIYLVEGFLINNRERWLFYVPNGLFRGVVCLLACAIAGIVYGALVNNITTMWNRIRIMNH